MRRIIIYKALAVAFLVMTAVVVRAQEPRQQVAGEKLKASRIEAKARSLKSMRPMLGIPQLSYNTASYSHNQRKDEMPVLRTNVICGMMYGEKISCENAVWMSWNQDFEMPNWIACDLDPTALASDRDVLAKNTPASLLNMNPSLWRAVLDECWKWAWDKPVGGATIVCGPLVSDPVSHIPYEYFLVICKKTGSGLGYKSIGFLIPNKPEADGGIYKYSQCVNLIEHKSGYDFFPKLPDGIQENVEGMTTYELYCSFVEESAYNDDPAEREEDWQDALNDYLEDFRDR